MSFGRSTASTQRIGHLQFKTRGRSKPNFSLLKLSVSDDGTAKTGSSLQPNVQSTSFSVRLRIT